MACGEPFDEYAMVAAHRTLPLGTQVEVTNLRNGRSVVLRIMDRGPNVAGRDIDVSKGAADRLRFTSRGLTRVKIRVLSTPAERSKETTLARDTRGKRQEAGQLADPSPGSAAGRRQTADAAAR